MRANLPETLAVVFFFVKGIPVCLGQMVWYSGTGAFFENVVHDVMILLSGGIPICSVGSRASLGGF